MELPDQKMPVEERDITKWQESNRRLDGASARRGGHKGDRVCGGADVVFRGLSMSGKYFA